MLLDEILNKYIARDDKSEADYSPVFKNSFVIVTFVKKRIKYRNDKGKNEYAAGGLRSPDLQISRSKNARMHVRTL